jgi:hypothetical protein
VHKHWACELFWAALLGLKLSSMCRDRPTVFTYFFYTSMLSDSM